MTRIEDLRNLGPTSAARLAEVGIASPAELDAVGAVEAFVRLRRSRPGTSANFLRAIEGALLDVDWRELPREHLDRILTEADARLASEERNRSHRCDSPRCD